MNVSPKTTETPNVTTKVETRTTPTRVANTQLADIFLKIGNKKDTKEGLNMLYDFLQLYPEIDIEPFLTRSSKFFQDYIRKNLMDIKEQRKCNIPQGILLEHS